MKRYNHVGQVRKRCTGEQAEARIIFLALVFFLMGVAVSALWFSRKPSANAAAQTEASPGFAPSANVSSPPPPAPQANLAALDAIKRSIPDVSSASLEEGTRILRQAALAEFQKTARELQARKVKAEENFRLGQDNQSAEQQQIATKQLKELQVEQAEKLKQIAAESKAQIETFQQLKGAAR